MNPSEIVEIPAWFAVLLVVAPPIVTGLFNAVGGAVKSWYAARKERLSRERQAVIAMRKAITSLLSEVHSDDADAIHKHALSLAHTLDEVLDDLPEDSQEFISTNVQSVFVSATSWRSISDSMQFNDVSRIGLGKRLVGKLLPLQLTLFALSMRPKGVGMESLREVPAEFDGDPAKYLADHARANREIAEIIDAIKLDGLSPEDRKKAIQQAAKDISGRLLLAEGVSPEKPDESEVTN